jgi:S-(hydroxymethyl)glutathione dehydrogenase / alcohol dehydrogenase
MTRAALLEKAGSPVSVMDLDLRQLGPGEARVRMGASGVCHSDVAVYEGSIGHPLPVVLGHEGAGTVTEVGEGVSSVAPGDHVVLSWLSQCGSCFYCQHGQPALCDMATAPMARGTLLDGTTAYSRDGKPVFQMAGLGTFAEELVVQEQSAVKVPQWLAFPQAALIGCAVLTGFGAAVNTAAVSEGESVAVIGCGGVGLNAIQGARICGAREIIAIDLHTERLELAARLGATRTLVPDDGLARQIRSLTDGRGVDVALEVAGRQESIDSAIKITRRGGRVILVGAGPADVAVRVPAFTGIVVPEKTIRGSFYGSSDVRRDVTRIIDLYASGAVKLDELISATFTLDDADLAIQYCAAEQGARAVIVS